MVLAADPTGSPDPSVEILDERSFKRAVEVTVSSTGHSLSELRRQARSGEFDSDRARIVWGTVSALLDESAD